MQHDSATAPSPQHKARIISYMSATGIANDSAPQRRHVDLATNCYGCHVPQKALDQCEEVCLLVVSELLRGDPAITLVN
ncbi:ARM repeat-containing protein [Mycena venus]|uniref:ARM repeat-containing protein n=1 Tax=Mycena venus TaxID=2733690 RepID=A0A8H7CU00_9AGAR|nr:ARM repeat-containing protein [Mycena venus]